MLLTILGVFANILYATACVPMAWKTFRLGHDIGNTLMTMWTFFVANILFMVYAIGLFGVTLPFLLLTIEVASWAVALFYHYFPRTKTKGRWLIGYCTRDDGHEGPCNGWPRRACKVYGSPCQHGHKDWDDCPVCCH